MKMIMNKIQEINPFLIQDRCKKITTMNPPGQIEFLKTIVLLIAWVKADLILKNLEEIMKEIEAELLLKKLFIDKDLLQKKEIMKIDNIDLPHQEDNTMNKETNNPWMILHLNKDIKNLETRTKNNITNSKEIQEITMILQIDRITEVDIEKKWINNFLIFS